MPRKVTPRWGEPGIDKVKVPSFTLNDQQMALLGSLLGNSSEIHLQLKRQLEWIGARCRLWTQQDEKGSSRAERNAALKRVLASPPELERNLAQLDHATQGELLDMLWAHLQTRGAKLGQLDQIARDDPELVIDCAKRLLAKSQKQRERPRKTLPIIIRWLVSVYEEATGLEFTHNPYERTEYRGTPQSGGGQFVAKFLKIVDPTLPETAIATEMARIVKTRRGSS